MMKTLVMLLTGGIFATALIVACSDDSPHDVDAATCDGPTAEPPLAGRIVQVRGADVAVAPNNGAAAGATCPASSVLMNGWCELEDGGAQAALVIAGPSPSQPQTWFCRWNNYNAGIGTVHAVAFCLMPPQ